MSDRQTEALQRYAANPPPFLLGTARMPLPEFPVTHTLWTGEPVLSTLGIDDLFLLPLCWTDREDQEKVLESLAEGSST